MYTNKIIFLLNNRMSLIHEGVNFPPVYIPTGYILHKKQKLYLNPLHEEYMVYWYKLKEIYRKDPTLLKNFLNSINKLKPNINNFNSWLSTYLFIIRNTNKIK